MSDNKRYYYLKLKEDFFNSDAMVVLESMPDGYKYSNILLKLYLRSLKQDGKLMFNDRIPYNSTILANVTRHSVGDIEKAIEIFTKLELIEMLENGAIYMLDIQNFIGKSTTEADRKRNYRKRIEEEKRTNVLALSDGSPTKSPPEIEIEIEKEIELEIDIESKKEVATTRTSAPYQNCIGYWQQQVNANVNTVTIDTLREWVVKFGEHGDAIVKFGIDVMLYNGASRLGYLEAILKEWYGAHVDSVEKAKAYSEQRKQQMQQAQTTYRRQRREEKLPDWMQENPSPAQQQPKQEEMTPEQMKRERERIDQQLADILSRTEARQ